MDWILGFIDRNSFEMAVGGGCGALLCFGFSLLMMEGSRYRAGLWFAIAELVSTVVCSTGWAWALKVSGKVDWFLFGLLGYTPLGVLCYAAYACGIWCVVRSVRRIRQQGSTSIPA